MLLLIHYLTIEHFEDDQSYNLKANLPIIIINSPTNQKFQTNFNSISQSMTQEPLTNIICSSKPQSSTNELPLTELDLEIFTSIGKDDENSKMSTNELPLSDITFRPRSNTCYNEGNTSELHDKFKLPKYKQRSFSDPNLLDTDLICCQDRLRWLEEKTEDLVSDCGVAKETTESSLSFCLCQKSLWFRRAPSTLLSFMTSPPNYVSPKHIRSISQPASPCVTSNPCMSYTESNSSPEKRHRHGIAGQMNYFRVIPTPAFGWDYPFSFKRTNLGSTNSLFSTAVISGSSSAPNLRDMIPSATSVSGIEGFGGVPSIRPLETLHSALSLRQIDAFLDRMTKASLFKTPSSTPPKYPSTPLPTPVGSQSASTNLSSFGEQPLKSPCNSGVWSEPQSYISSSGQSSPGLSETNSKESSDMSSSAISYDGYSKH